MKYIRPLLVLLVLASVGAASVNIFHYSSAIYMRENLIKTASEMDVETVSFYARIIDQFGQPVVGAVLRYSIMGSMLGGYTAGRLTSDDKGNVVIKGSGGAITIMGISKPGYVFLAAECLPDLSNCDVQKTDFFAATGKTETEKTWYDHKTPDKAYVFKLQKLGYVEGVDSNRFGLSPGKAGHCETYKFFPYEMDPYLRISTDPKARGQIRACLIDDSDNAWKMEIQAIGGGIMEAKGNDLYMSIAPDSGYQDTYIFDCRDKDECISGATRRFYFYSNGGKEYGAMVVRINFGVEGFYRINTKGGHDLNVPNIEKLDLDGAYR